MPGYRKETVDFILSEISRDDHQKNCSIWAPVFEFNVGGGLWRSSPSSPRTRWSPSGSALPSGRYWRSFYTFPKESITRNLDSIMTGIMLLAHLPQGTCFFVILTEREKTNNASAQKDKDT